MHQLAAIFDRLSGWCYRLALGGAVIALTIMLAAAIWQVVARYVLASPPAWTEEIARFSMVWAGLLGASCGFKLHADPSLFPERQAQTGRIGVALALVRAGAVLLFALPVLWYSLFNASGDISRGYIARLMARKAETMDVVMAVFGIAIPIAFTFIVVHILADLIKRVAEWPESPAGLGTPPQ